MKEKESPPRQREAQKINAKASQRPGNEPDRVTHEGKTKRLSDSLVANHGITPDPRQCVQRSSVGESAGRGGASWYKGHTDRKPSFHAPLADEIWNDFPHVEAGPNYFSLRSGKQNKLPREIEKVPRGKVQGISRKSAARLSREMASVRVPDEVPCIHLTITLPRQFSKDSATLKRQFKTFAQWLRDRDYFGFWRLEFQLRGAPHWHLILWNVEGMNDDQEKLHDQVRAHWRKITENESRAAAFISPGNGRAAWYLAAHHAKNTRQGVWPEWWTGKAWGFINQPELNEYRRVSNIAVDLDPFDIVWLYRISDRFMRAKTRETFTRRMYFWHHDGRNGPPPKLRKYRRHPHARGFTLYLPEFEHQRVLHLVNDLATRDRESFQAKSFHASTDRIERVATSLSAT